MNLETNRLAFLKLPKPKAVIFDWDNTLVDTWPLIHLAIDTTMEAMGKERWGLEKVRNNVHKSMRESFPEIFGTNWEEAGEIYKNTYRSVHLDKLRLLPNTLELVSKLEEQGIIQFIVSNKIGATLRKEVEKIGIEKKFFAIVGSLDSSRDKPSKDPVDLALLGSDLDPAKDEIWFIGDTIADIECALNSGCRPILYAHPDNKVSSTVSEKIFREGGGKGSPLPIYFNHSELVELLAKLK
ncbi:MAG: HAD hydrolase-like protein [Proteobacteria bacterium]|nr:HAD hydrolase-like protein [Pseudomonadota bacterium]